MYPPRLSSHPRGYLVFRTDLPYRPPSRRRRITLPVLPVGLMVLGFAVAAVPIDAAEPLPVLQRPSRQEIPETIRREAGRMVPMRDGVRLSTDLYFPAGAEGPFSTILMRTPYGKDREYPYGGTIPLLVEAGYVFVFQDTRGRFGSEGDFTPRFSDRDDGYDMVTWLAEQPWSNGKVATFGCSYRGETQITIAAERHPNHVAMMPMAAAAGYDPGGRPWTAFDGGAFELAQTAGWFMPGAAADRLDLYRTLPVVDVVQESGAIDTEDENYATSPPAGDYFGTLDFVRKRDRFDVPALYVDSWYDFGVAETFQLFNQQRERALSATARDNQYVIITPSTHCAWIRPANTKAGDRDVGEWQLDFQELYLRWYRHWLDGEDAGIEDLPHVQYYLMGANEWKQAAEWPVPGTSFERFYLHSRGAANSASGDGTLSRSSPADEPTRRLPVRSRGSRAFSGRTNVLHRNEYRLRWLRPERDRSPRRRTRLHLSGAGGRPGGDGSTRGRVVRVVRRSRYRLHGEARGRGPGRDRLEHPGGRAAHALPRGPLDRGLHDRGGGLRDSARPARHEQLLRAGAPYSTRGVQLELPALEPKPEHRGRQSHDDGVGGRHEYGSPLR